MAFQLKGRSSPLKQEGPIGKVKKPITNRDDFKPSILSKIPGLTSLASGNQPGYNRQERYGPLGDLYRYYGGQELKHGVLEESSNKPRNSKDPKAKYISLNKDPEFVKEVTENYARVSSGKLDKGIESKLSNNSWAVSGYSSSGKNAHKTTKQGSEHHSNAIGRYTLGKGKDERGDYISYYDKFDQGTGGGLNPGETLGLTKPFEIYDRIYLNNKKTTPLKKQNLSPKAAKAKAERDLAYAKTDDRRIKKAHSQRMHRKDSKGKGMDYDHEDGRFESVKQNRGNEGEGTKKESGKNYKRN